MVAFVYATCGVTNQKVKNPITYRQYIFIDIYCIFLNLQLIFKIYIHFHLSNN